MEPLSFALGAPVLGDAHRGSNPAQGCSQHHSQLWWLKHFYLGRAPEQEEHPLTAVVFPGSGCP